MTRAGKRIGILGGSFNPVHNGHLAIARGMLERNIVDKVILMVSPQNPLKTPEELADENMRLSLARLACSDEKQIIASDFEFSLPRPSYTWQTLEALTAKYPDYKFKLLIGADNWEIFHSWYHADDIMTRYEIALYPRKGYNIDILALPAGVEYVDMPLYDISSTEIRTLIHEDKDASAMLPENVYKEIISSGLYQHSST